MKTTFPSLLLLTALAAPAAPVAAQTLPVSAAAAAAAGSKATAPAPAAKAAVAALNHATPPLLTGTVADSLGRQGLPFATVLLQAAADARTVLSTITDAQGAFRFEAVPAGQYELRVRYLGYKPSAPVAVAVAADHASALPAVLLAADRQLLKGVTVKASRPFIEQRADKLVLNVAASPIAAGGTAYDVLGRAPGVLESGTGFQLRGKSVTVLLDGKATNLSGGELKTMLSALPGNSLDQVEIIANPSARYDANGAAIINLITAKSRKFGTNGTATVGVGSGQFGRTNAGLNLNHRTEKLNLYGGLDRLDNKTYSTTSAVRTAENGPRISESGRDERQNHNNSARVGLDYQVSANTSLGFLLKGSLNQRARTGSNLAELDEAASGRPLAASFVASAGSSQMLNPAINLYFKTKLDTLGRTLSLNADYFGYRKDTHTSYATQPLDGRFENAGPLALLRDNSPVRNAVRSASADFAQPIHHGTLEAGLKTTFTTTDNDIRWEQALEGQPWAVDAGKTNHFIYRENVNAAYVSLNRAGNNVDVQLGLRAEQTNTTGTSLTTGQSTTRHYLNLFPMMAAQYKLSEKSRLGLSYSRKIDRFQFGIVNPFVTYVSQYRYLQGNPNIQPSYSHNFELTHSFGDLLSTSLSYGHHTNVLVESYTKNDASQVVVSSYQNFGSAETVSASTTLMQPLLNGKWSTVTTLGLEYARVNSAAVGLRAARPSGYLSSNHTVRLPHGFKAEASAMYMSPMTFGGVAFHSRLSSSFGVSKALFKAAATLTLNVTDPFNQQQTGYDVLANGVNSTNLDKIESRFVKLNFSYKFGNQRVKASQRRRTGTEAEQGRMEN